MNIKTRYGHGDMARSQRHDMGTEKWHEYGDVMDKEMAWRHGMSLETRDVHVMDIEAAWL